MYCIRTRHARPAPQCPGSARGRKRKFRPGFDPWLQYVVNELGFAVVAPNPRGSSGYGKAHLALDNGMLRDDVVWDLGAIIVCG